MFWVSFGNLFLHFIDTSSIFTLVCLHGLDYAGSNLNFACLSQNWTKYSAPLSPTCGDGRQAQMLLYKVTEGINLLRRGITTTIEKDITIIVMDEFISLYFQRLLSPFHLHRDSQL